jgi:hypothetical protein
MLERAGAALPRKPLAAADERRERIEPQGASQGAQWAFSEPQALEYVGQRWLHAILEQVTTRPAPPVGGKWDSAYRYIGSRPAAERAAVEPVLRRELAEQRLKAAMCTPLHMQDYWEGYVAGEPPRSSATQRAPAQSWSSAPPTREQIEAEAAQVPEWLRGKAAV